MEVENKVYKNNPTLNSVIKILEIAKGFKRISIIINTGGGKEQAFRNISRRKDIREFVKIYTSPNYSNLTNLGLTAQKVLWFIMSKINVGDDYVFLNSSEFTSRTNLSRQSFSVGINELLKHNWIYKSEYRSKYWINLHYISKGNAEQMYYKYIANKE